MRAVVQRVRQGSVTVEGQKVAQIQAGLVILLAIGPQDNVDTVNAMARKIAMLRIFSDDQGKMNLSVLDIHGEAIVVSQFTLYADTHKGNRPSFFGSAAPEVASPLVDHFAGQLRQLGVPTQCGVFGAHMVVEIINDGPVTIPLDM
ncbi:MAG: D-tyrosyl-tRNA(Tyr) deacylase [Chloroflexi bacterium]|nr:D-aminoacyl-tRNA deacylase [Anaerolineaceae bacterium]NMB89568.1 D-tyrosyl-tRNA(Tyr) deacylase [Chloroflexota bacterium]